METKDFKNNEEQQMEQGAGIDINTDDSIAGDQLLNDPVAEESEVEKLKQKIDELNDKYLRQAAEFDNFRRRNAKEKIELIQTAGREVITELLEVLDDYERAETQMQNTEDVAQVKAGTQLIFNKLRHILTCKGLKPMNAKGTEFNADLHEAITEIEAGDKMKGKVVDEVTKGYYLNDKIIRFAKVVVGK